MYENFILKTVVLGTSLASVLLMIFLPSFDISLWKSGTQYGDVITLFDFLTFAVPIAIFAMITFLLRSRVYVPWLVWTLGWFLISVTTMPYTSASSVSFGPTQRSFFLAVSFVIYFTISALIILIQSIRTYWLGRDRSRKSTKN